MARTPIIAGNWKMNRGTTTEATTLANDLLPLVAGVAGVDIVVCPPFTMLGLVAGILTGSPVTLGAQNTFWKESGAYTGQIAPSMLRDTGVRYVILGHSEARGRFGVAEPDFTSDTFQHFGETDETVNRKARATLATGLIPIICVGETLFEHQAHHTDSVIVSQVTGALEGIAASDVAALVLAYEPVWAIGTGETCSPDAAERVCGVIRATVESLYDAPTAQSVRIQYGGSMKPDNAADLLARPNIDGGLIGGASLKAADFAAIVRAVA